MHRNYDVIASTLTLHLRSQHLNTSQIISLRKPQEHRAKESYGFILEQALKQIALPTFEGSRTTFSVRYLQRRSFFR